MRASWLVGLLLAGCSADPAWEQAASGVDGVTFRAITGLGEEISAFGTEAGGDPVVARFDGGWSAEETTLQPSRAWTSAGGDLWTIHAGDLRRGTESIDLSSVLAVEPGAYLVTHVWGTTSDDVYAIVDLLLGMGQARTLLHFDGEAWSVDDSWHDVVSTIGQEESGAVLQQGCSTSPDDVWVAGYVYYGIGTDALLLHWDGTAWRSEYPSGEGSSVFALGCGAMSAWAAVDSNDSNDGTMLLRGEAGSWTRISSLAREAYDIEALAAHDDEAWLVGSENAGEEGVSIIPQIWRVTDVGAEPMLHGDLGLEQLAPFEDWRLAPLLGVWMTDAGRVFVFGRDGLILERL